MSKLASLLCLSVLISITVPASASVKFVENTLAVDGPTGVLTGYFRQPDALSSTPVVIIVPGSGPTDHNGNSPSGLNASSYSYLAAGLAEAGIASIRIDKRGMFASAGAATNPNAVTIGDYADDLNAWINQATRQSHNHCAWVLGHSEGALVAEVAAAKNQNICGLILVAGAGRRLGDVLRDQLRSNPANQTLLPQAFDAIQKMEAGQRVDTTGFHPALGKLFRPEVQGFLISELALDPGELLRACKLPVLIIQGTNDLQIGIQDAELLKKADPQARLELIDGMNHVLKTVPDANRAANFASYSDPTLPLAEKLLPIISSFINGYSAGSK